MEGYIISLTMAPSLPQRHSIRIPGYDYTFPGAYFVTIVTHQRECFLSTISNDPEPVVILTPFGKVVQDAWNMLPRHHPNMGPVQIAIMPNHVHLLMTMKDTPKPDSISTLVGLLKTFSARRINALRCTPGRHVWQRNFYEHIIRNNTDWCALSAYMLENPRRWLEDAEYQENR
jgi:putative transposase